MKLRSLFDRSFKNTNQAFRRTVALIGSGAAYKLPTHASKIIQLIFEAVGVNVSAPEAFSVINYDFVLKFLHNILKQRTIEVSDLFNGSISWISWTAGISEG